MLFKLSINSCELYVIELNYKIKLQSDPFDDLLVKALRTDLAERLKISLEEASNFIFSGEAVNTTYNPDDEHTKILYKDGTISDISKVDNALIHQQVSSPVKKYYLCYFR